MSFDEILDLTADVFSFFLTKHQTMDAHTNHGNHPQKQIMEHTQTSADTNHGTHTFGIHKIIEAHSNHGRTHKNHGHPTTTTEYNIKKETNATTKNKQQKKNRADVMPSPLARRLRNSETSGGKARPARTSGTRSSPRTCHPEPRARRNETRPSTPPSRCRGGG